MVAPNNQELEIIQAFSSVSVPEKIIRESNIKGLIHDIVADQEAVQTDAQRLERLRQEQKEGYRLINLIKGRAGKVQDAQIDLNKSIGRLTQNSSQLLIVNTAISKVLNDQQHILLEQQYTLKNQADTLEEQNRKILEQQELLEQQQKDINKANQGLLEAKGITQEQAQKLVGCVKRVTEAEEKIDTANEALRIALEQRMHDSASQCIDALNDGFAKQTQHHDALKQQLETKLAAQSRHTQVELERSASDTNEFKTNIGQQLQAHVLAVTEKTSAQDVATQQLRETLSVQLTKLQQDLAETAEKKAQALRETVKGVEAQLAVLQIEQQRNASRNRLALAAAACLALAALGWQVAQHFALV